MINSNGNKTRKSQPKITPQTQLRKSQNISQSPFKNSQNVTQIQKINHSKFTSSAIKNNHPLAILPSQLVFQLNSSTQQLNIQIKNISSQPLKVKLTKPKTNHFRIVSLQGSEDGVSVILVPGLGRKITVQYNNPKSKTINSKPETKQKQKTNRDPNGHTGWKVESSLDQDQLFDSVKILSQIFCLQIPLYAQRRSTEIQYQKLVNLGFLPVNKLSRFSHTFYNPSPTEQVGLTLSKPQPASITDSLHIQPQQLTIKPLSTQKVQLSLTPNQQGSHHQKVLLLKNNSIIEPIQILYIAGESQCWISNENGTQRISQVNFGYGYFGKDRKITFYAVNNTPNLMEMKSKIRVGWKNHDVESVFQSPEQYGVQCSSTTVDIQPKIFRLQPFSRQKFSLISCPKVNQLHESKVIKYSKSVGEQKLETIKIKSSKKINESIEKYRIQDEQFRECLLTEFIVVHLQGEDAIKERAQEEKTSQKTKDKLESKYQPKPGSKQKPSSSSQKQSKIIQLIRGQHQHQSSNFTILTTITSKYTLPRIRIHPVEIIFYEKLITNQQHHMKLTLTNSNTKLQSKVEFGKVLGVDIIPKQVILKPQETKDIDVFVKPVKIGILNQNLKILIEEKFVVDIRVYYEGVMGNEQWNLMMNSTQMSKFFGEDGKNKNMTQKNYEWTNINRGSSSHSNKTRQGHLYQSLYFNNNKNISETKNRNNSSLFKQFDQKKKKLSSGGREMNFSRTIEQLQKTHHNQVYSLGGKSLHKNYHNSSQSYLVNYNKLNNALQNKNHRPITTHNDQSNLAERQRGIIKSSSSSLLFNIRKGRNLNTSYGGQRKNVNEKEDTLPLKDQPDLEAKQLQTVKNTNEGNNSSLNINNNNNNNSKLLHQQEINTYEQHTHPTKTISPSPIRLPSPSDPLYVTKKIDRYEPYSSTHKTRKLLKSKTSKQFLSNLAKRQPRNRRQAQQITMELKGEQLKMIKINSKSISFGKVFVGSTVQKQFTIDNQTEYSIEVKLKYPSCSQTPTQRMQQQMLKQTDFSAQLIPPGITGRFNIKLWAKQCGHFQKTISYVINNHHEFQFLVEAQIQLASLMISKNVLKMVYLDDIGEMWLKDTFGLRNEGNADVSFNIQQQRDNFMIQPSEGCVKPGTTLDINLTYKTIQTIINAGDSLPSVNSQKSPTNNNNKLLNFSNNQSLLQQNFQQERISINIKNGVNLSLRVTFNSNITEPKCIVKQQRINFGATIVNKPKTKSFLLRNLSRTMTLFEIQNTECGQFLYFDVMKGRLPPQSSKELSVTYKSSSIQQIESSFKVICRGGLTINVPVMAESVAPNIRLLQEEYNFGDVCCGSAQVLAVNIKNDSETVVELLLDMLDKKNSSHNSGMEYLLVSLKPQQQPGGNNGNINCAEENNAKTLNSSNNSNTKKLLSMSQSQQQHQQLSLNGNNANVNMNNTKQTFENQNQKQQQRLFSNIPYNLHAQQEAIIDRACLQPQIHKLTVNPKSTYQFHLIFKPKLPGYYEFELPLYLQNFIKNELLEKRVFCFATEPKFVVEPSIVKFKKKIIDDKQCETVRPLVEFLTLKNSSDKELKWKIQLPTIVSTNNPNASDYQSFFESNLNYQQTTAKSFSENTPSNSLTYQQQQIDPHFAFHLQTTKGVVKPHSWQCINISFNPYEAGLYCYRVALWIWNNDRGVYQQEAEIRLEGQGQYPMLLFDRREVILPVVPLGIQSIGMFRVINEGYENISLKYRLTLYDLQGNSIIQGTNYYSSQNNSPSISNNTSVTQQSVSLPQISLLFPQGTKMGINKKELFVLVKFVSRKPISFTCRLQLYDNTKDNRVYELPMSGTADFSLLTIWPYLNDKQNKWKLSPGFYNTESTKHQSLEQGPKNSTNSRQQTISSSMLANKISNKATQIILPQSTLQQGIILEEMDDRSPIDKFHNPYDRLSEQDFGIDCEIARRWINGVLRDEKVGRFPQDLVVCPEWILKMLHKLTGRKQFQILAQANILSHASNDSITPNNNNSSTANMNSTSSNFNPNNNTTINSNSMPSHQKQPQNINLKSQNALNATSSPSQNNASNPLQQLIPPNQFSSKLELFTFLIKLLKSMGCLLNHIRPQFFVEKDEFLSYMESVTGWKYMAQTYTKNFAVIHVQAWLILFYQIINNFWYNTSKLKSTLVHDKHSNTNNANFSTSLSNCYSITQISVLRWVKGIYQKYRQFDDTQFKFLSYSSDFTDCVALSYAVYEHIVNPQKKRKALEGLIAKPNTENQRHINLKILYQLIQKVGLVPMIYEEQFFQIKQKEMFMFLYQLYEMLPQQLPKTEPIYFECYLGESCSKYIEIKNTSNKAVHYWIKLQGSRDFKHEEKQSIKVEGKSVYKFKVNFESRVSEEEVGYLTFLNKLQSSSNEGCQSTTSGSTLVFQLRSRITGRKSVKKLQPICCGIYETQMVRIAVENFYEEGEYGQFEIFLFEQVLDGKDEQKEKKTLGATNNNNSNINKINKQIRMFKLPNSNKLKTQQSERIKEGAHLSQQNPQQKQSLFQDQSQQQNIQSQLATNNVTRRNQNSSKSPTFFNNNSLSLTNNNNTKEVSQSLQKLNNFFIDVDTIKIKRNSTAYLELYFNPLVYSKIKCYLIFLDPNVGEFQYEIIGISELPKIYTEIKHPAMLYTGIKETIDISIPLLNNPMLKANLLMEQKAIIKNQLIPQQPKINKKNNNQQQFFNETFKIQLNMDSKILSHISFPSQFIIKSPIIRGQIASFLNQQAQNNNSGFNSNCKIKFDCLFSTVLKDLCLDFLLVNQKKTDVRRIKVHLNIANRPIISQLVMKTTARVPIVQPIPIDNSTNKDWRVKVTITEDEETQKFGYLSLKEGEKVLTKDIVIKKNSPNQTNQIGTSTTLQPTQTLTSTQTNSNNSASSSNVTQNLTIVFNPSWTCKLNSKLHIHNLTTNQQLIYYIKAISEEPVSQGHFMFKARTGLEEQKTITVKNPYNELLSYRVETDLTEISLPQKVTLNPLAKMSIPITIYSPVTKKSIGYVKLTSLEKQNNNKFFWYTIVVDFCEEEIQQKSIDISCELGQKVQKLLQVKNPLDKKVTFTVECPQGNDIHCPKLIEVEKQSLGLLKIVFQPKEMLQKTISIKISNKQLGLLIYKLSLFTMAHRNNPNQKITAEVNKMSFSSIMLYNPLKTQIKISSEMISQSKYFQLKCPQVLQPLSQTEVILQFRPLEQGKYKSVVKIYGEQFQTKMYQIQGIGIKPFSIEKIQMKAQVDHPSLEIIRFKNPDIKRTQQSVEVVLQNQQFQHDYFMIVTENGNVNQWVTKVTDVLAIPIQFSPLQKGYFQSMLYVRCAHYQWKYMLKGSTQGKNVDQVKEKIQGQCRRQLMKIIKISIPPYLKKIQNFSIQLLDRIELQCTNEKILHLLRSCMQIRIESNRNSFQSTYSNAYQKEQNKPYEKELKQQEIKPKVAKEKHYNEHEQEEITLMCKLNSPQPFQQIVELIIYNSQSQGSMRLSHKVKVTVKPSEPDQSIQIDINSVKKYKLDIDLEQIGVISKRGLPLSCSMLKGDYVECNFKPIQQLKKVNANLKNSSSQSSINFNKTTQNSVVEVIFSPNNVMFSNLKAKNQYTDVLMIFTEKNFWSCEIVFKINNLIANKKI